MKYQPNDKIFADNQWQTVKVQLGSKVITSYNVGYDADEVLSEHDHPYRFFVNEIKRQMADGNTRISANQIIGYVRMITKKKISNGNAQKWLRMYLNDHPKDMNYFLITGSRYDNICNICEKDCTSVVYDRIYCKHFKICQP